ncbi:hypothetical protein B1813_13040 [Saccharomonospora piscinae]|uniref:Uncharacterized protein n=1 Tax=Saccharomonospora piscinae TaxID=687388 RepID=A0A1V9A7F3_SACPI|nr:hypothetical protein B1813_13040 [Saccharomonospora piscinae]
MATKKQVRAWEDAYRRYGTASERVARTRRIDTQAAHDMAAASRDVASAWRSIASGPDLPWWLLAALDSAAQAFEQQSRDWHERAAGRACGAGSVRPPDRASGRRRRGPDVTGEE